MPAFVGKEAVDGFRTMMILSELRMEVKIPGYRASRKVPKSSTIVRREWGFKGNPQKLLEQLEAWIKANKPTVETSEGAISTLHSNPAPKIAAPFFAYVQSDGGLALTPAPKVKLKVFVPGRATGQEYHVHMAGCEIWERYGPDKEYGGDGQAREIEARSDTELCEILQVHADDIGYGRCILGAVEQAPAYLKGQPCE